MKTIIRLSVILITLLFYTPLWAQTDYIPTEGTTTTINVPSSGYENVYDPGGPGGSLCPNTNSGGTPGNFPNCGCITVVTICHDIPGTPVELDFFELGVNPGFDFMTVYDNNSASGTVLYNNDVDGRCGLSSPLVATNPSGCLTIELDVTTVVNDGGFGAEIILAPTGPNDAGIASLVTPQTGCPGAIEPVEVEVANFGINRIDSVDVFWRVNGALQTPFQVTDTIGTSESINVTLGNVTFTPNQSLNIQAWTQDPNGVSDTVTANDTLNYFIEKPSFTGTFTAGTPTSDFAGVQEAIDSLDKYGVCGPVVVNIEQGTYTGQITVPEILGASATNTITFQSAGQDSSSVVLSHPSSTSSADNYLMLLDGADYFTFQHLTLERMGGEQYATIVELANGANYNNFFNNELRASRGYSTIESGDYSSFYSSSSTDDVFNTFTNNYFNGNGNGFWFYNTSGYTSIQSSIVIENNRFETFYVGAFVIDQSNPKVLNNFISRTNPTSNEDFFGISIRDATGENIEVAYNQVYGKAGDIGIRIRGITAPALSPALVYNNFAQVANDDGKAFWIDDDAENVLLVHNNGLSSGTISGSGALSIEGSATIGVSFINNNFYNNNGGNAVYVGSANSIDSTDYNNAFTTGAELANIGGIAFPTLSDIQTNTGTNLNSISVDPLYLSANNLSAFAPDLDGAGTALPGITDDIFGETRTLPADIGANIVDAQPSDVSLASIDNNTICSGPQDISVTILNTGTQPLNSALVAFRVDGVLQTPFNFGGTLGVGEDSSFVIGSFNFTSSPNPYNITAWVSDPNGAPDPNTQGDTVSVSLTTSLNGIFSIDPSGAGDYLSFNDALDALEDFGVCGPVVFNAVPGLYPESIQLNEVNGASAINTITFDGGDSTLVALEYDGSGNSGSTYAVVYLNGADYVTFKNMTVRHSGADTDEWGFMLSNAANFNTIEACKIEVELIGTTFDVAGIVASADEGNDFSQGDNANYNTFRGNLIIGGEKNIHLEGDDGGLNVGNKIINNRLFGADDHAIEVDDQDSLNVEDNIVRDLQDSGADAFDLLDINNFFIVGNDIISPDYGIDIDDGNDGITPSVQSVVANNFVISTSDGALRLSDNNGYTDVLHNTLLGEPGIYLNDLQAGNRIVNNIFASNTGFAFENADADPLDSLDYNIYYTPASNTNFVEVGGIALTDLADFQANFPGNNNSLEGNPVFVGPEDLHVIGPLADSAATPFGIMTDIDGQARNMNFPDIGADEFDVFNNDAGVAEIPIASICPGNSDVSVRILNYGVQDLNSVDIFWTVDGVLQTPFSFGGVLPPFEDSTFVIGSFNFGNFTQSYDIQAWTVNPNGTTDEDLSNDTTLVAGVRAGLDGIYTIDTTGNGDFVSFNDAVNALVTYGVCGPVVFNAQPGLYAESIRIPELVGSSATNTVTFDGGDSTLVTLEYDGGGGSGSDEAVVYLNGADHMRFRNMTVRHTGGSDAWGFLLGQAANYNIIEACKIEVDPEGTFDEAGVVFSDSETSDTSPGDNANFNIVRGNLIMGGELNVSFEGDDGAKNRGNQLINNRLLGADDHAFICDDQDSLILRGNYVRNLRSGFADAFELTDVDNFFIEGNDIISPDYGIDIDDGNDGITPSVQSVVANNFVISTSDGALRLSDNNGYTDVLHNTLLGEPGIYLNDLQAGNRIVNNIFASNTDFAFENADADPLDSLDYNIYYTPASNTNFVELGGIAFANLADFQGNFPGNNNSLEGNPIFVGPEDLHVIGPLADSAATPFGFMTDIDGDNRNMNFPDIGADEFDVRNVDALVVEVLDQPQDDCDITSDSITVLVSSFGVDTLSNIEVYYSVNGGTTQLGGTGNSSIGIGGTDTVLLTGFDFTQDGVYNIEIFVSVANDEDLSNDTISTTVENLAIPALVIDNVSQVCDSGTATIDVSTSAGMINWYLEEDTASAIYDTGRSIVTPFLTASDTLYAELIDQRSGFLGAVDNSIGTTNSSSLTNQYMIFDVFTTTTLESVVLVGDGTGGTLTVALEDNNSNVLQTANLNIIDGPNRYNLGFVIQPGTGYQLRVQDFGAADIFRNTNGASYPYEFPGVISITGNSFDPDYYYYFYDWEVLVQGCNSGLIPVAVPVNESPTVDLGSDVEICANESALLDAGNAGSDFAWSNGETTQTVNVSAAGDYSVTVTDISTCTGSDTVNVSVNALPTVDIGNDTTLCDTAWVIFDAGAGFNQYRWRLNGALVGNQPMITVEDPGTYTLEATNADGCIARDTATLNVEVCGGLEDIFGNDAVSVYPNPNSGQFNLNIDLELSTDLLFTVHDLSGKTLYQEELNLQAGSSVLSYDFEEILSTGVYLIKLRSEKDHYVERLVVN